MAKLALNQIFTLKVKEIIDAKDSYPKNGTGDTMYCHYFVLCDDEGEEYPAQTCNEFPKQSFCSVGDMVKVQIKSFTRNIYTFAPIEVLAASGLEKPKMEETYAAPYQGPIGELVKTHNNPNIAGTILDRAMTLAIAYYKDNEVPFQKVTEYADMIAKWFREGMQQ